MTINLSVPQHGGAVLHPSITVVGVGGAGGNAVNNMISSQLEGVEFLVANTDSQALVQSLSDRKIQLGHTITHGLGAGSRPDVGRAAAEEVIDELAQHLQGVHMVFVTAGMGGGTGTGAAPVIARLAREHGILTVGVVTKPFQFEGINRMRIAEAGIEEMQQYVDTLIVIPNQNLFRVANEKTTFADAFSMADQVLHSGVRGVTDLMVVPGLINLDFADIRTVMGEMGKAMMGTGEAEGEERARCAAESAISNPLLDEVSMKGARGVLINITGGPDMTLFEVDEAANRIGDEVDAEANIIFGSTMDPALEGRLRVSVVATGIEAEAAAKPRPVLKVYTNQPVGEEHPVVDAGIPENAPFAQGGAQFGPEPRSEPAAPVTSVAPPAVESPPEPVATAGSYDAKTIMPTRSVSPFEMPQRTPPQLKARITERTAAVADPNATVDAGPAEIPADSPAPAPMPPTAPMAPTVQDAFMPPPSVDARRSPEPGVKSDPFQEAAMLNGGGAEAPKRRGPNLFQRMTGTVLARKEEQAETPESGPGPVKTASDPAPEAAPVVREPEPAPRQTRLEGVEPQDRAPASQSEEDLLDIPAFLRRQAN